MLTFDAESFTRNPKGYPVLSKAHQALVNRFMRLRTRPWLLLCDIGPLPGVNAAQSNGVPDHPISATNAEAFPTPAEASTQAHLPEKHLKDPSPHLSYLRNLQTRQPPGSPLERFSAGYQDYLQAPLQPLTVNLESITYEVFEKDPVKYDWYEKAIARALHDWIEQGKPTSNSDGRVVVAVVGAGRGPLVTRALRASEDVGVEIDMWALEKNPNAFVLLQRHNAEIWNNRVNLVKSDMRTWRGPLRSATHTPAPPADSVAPIGPSASAAPFTGDAEVDRDYLLASAATAPKSAHYPVDILISELLGSFADNELSPECLDGVQHLLNPTHGISIPASYTAHLTPIAAPKLHADISSQSISNSNAPETPFVVMLHAIDYLSTTISPPAQAQPSSPSQYPPRPEPLVQTAWSFAHPNPQISGPLTPPISNIHNTRHATLRFPIPNRAVCHGLAGYFEAVLYGSVHLSTNPSTMDDKSAGMISWFPIYFPLKTPLTVPDSSEIVVNIWRQSDDRRVWYEWLVEAYAVLYKADLDIDVDDDVKARTKSKIKSRHLVKVGTSELHSSIKEACLM